MFADATHYGKEISHKTMLQLNLFDTRTYPNVNAEQLILKLDAPVLQKAKLIVDVGSTIARLVVVLQKMVG